MGSVFEDGCHFGVLEAAATEFGVICGHHRDPADDHVSNVREVHRLSIGGVRHFCRTDRVAGVTRPPTFREQEVHLHDHGVVRGHRDEFVRRDRGGRRRRDPIRGFPRGIETGRLIHGQAVHRRHRRIVADREGVLAGLQGDGLARGADDLPVDDDVARDLVAENGRLHQKEAFRLLDGRIRGVSAGVAGVLAVVLRVVLPGGGVDPAADGGAVGGADIVAADEGSDEQERKGTDHGNLRRKSAVCW